MKTIFRKLLLTAVAISMLGLKCHAANLVWTNIAGGNWSAAANWNPNQVPTTNDDVVISDPATYQIVLDAPASTSNFTFTAASCVLTGNFALTIEGKLTWSAGVLAGNSGNLATTVKRGADLGGGLVPPAVNKRLLSLQELARLSSRLELRNGAKIRIETNGAFEALPGGEFYHPNSPDVSIENLGTFRILPGAMNFSCFGSPFANSGTVEIQNRTNRFDGFTQDATNAVLRLTDAAIPDGASIDISRGALLGRGSLRLVEIGSPSFGPPAMASGTFAMETLTMGHYCKAAFTIGGRTNGSFDHFTMTHLFAISDPTLEVRFANGFENSVSNSDVFEIVSAQPGLTFSGKFGNVPFGQRLLTSDLAGTFVVDTNSSQSVVLRDFQPSLPYIWIFSETNLYPFVPKFCFLDSNAIVAVRPGTNVTWSGGVLEVQLQEGYDNSQDSLEVLSEGNLPGQIGIVPAAAPGTGEILYGGLEFATFYHSIAGGLSCSFEGTATAQAIQGLVRRIYYTNNTFGANLFSDTSYRFPNRKLQVKLTDADGFSANNTKTQTVEFPYLSGLKWPVSDLYLDVKEETTIQLYSLFSNGQQVITPALLVSVSTCSSQVISVQPYPIQKYHLFSGGQRGQCSLIAQAGPFSAQACVHVLDTTECPIGAISPYDYCPTPVTQSGSVTPARKSAIPSPVLLSPFYSLQALMTRTAEGARLASLYWQHAAEVTSILKTNSTLIAESLGVLRSFQPAVLDLLSGNGNASTIRQDMIDNLNSVWNQVAASGSSALQSAMATERGRFNNFQDFLGKNFSQWANMLQIPAPTQPWIYLSRSRVVENKFIVEANPPSGFYVQLWTSGNLVDWQASSSGQMVLEGATLVITDTNLAPVARFYQVRATPLPK